MQSNIDFTAYHLCRKLWDQYASVWEDCRSFACWQNEKAAVQIAASLSPSVDIKHRLRDGALGLQSIFEATRLQKVSSSLSNLAMIFLQRSKTLPASSPQGGQINSVDVAHHLCVRVSLCLCGRGRDSAALYLYFSGQVKCCLGSCKRLQSKASAWNYCTDWVQYVWDRKRTLVALQLCLLHCTGL